MNYSTAVPDFSRDKIWVYKSEVVQNILERVCQKMCGSVIYVILYI